MKKKIILGTMIGLCFGGCVATSVIIANKPMTVSAMAEELPAEPTEPTEEPEITEEDLKTKVNDWLSQYVDQQLVSNIINWAIDTGLLGALFAVVVKYNKLKTKTVDDLIKEFENKLKKWFKEEFDKLSAEQIKKVIDGIENAENKMDCVMKAFVLMQDKTADGKIAMLDLIAKNTSNSEVVEIVEKEKDKVKEDQKVVQAIQDAVKDEYEPVE